MQSIQDGFNKLAEDLQHEVDLVLIGDMPSQLHRGQAVPPLSRVVMYLHVLGFVQSPPILVVIRLKLCGSKSTFGGRRC